MPGDELTPGAIAWVAFDSVRERERGGRRPVLVLSSAEYLEVVTALAVVVPVTAVDHGWPNHVVLRGDTGLTDDSWAMTEQLRTISRGHLTWLGGRVAASCLVEVQNWVADFLNLTPPRAGSR